MSNNSLSIRLGLVGFGRHGQHAVVPAIGLSRHATLVAVADQNPQAWAAADLPATVRRFASAEAMFAQADLDVVYIATLVETHAPLAIAAFRAGLHVVCEKPMAPTAEDCQRMIDAADTADRHLVVNFENRYLPHFGQLRQWVAEGRFGQLQAIHLQQFWDGHKNFGPVAERRKRLLDRAGALDCGIHKLDMARFLAGGGHWSQIQAMGAWLQEDFEFPPHISLLGQLGFEDRSVLVSLNASLGYAAGIAPRPMQDMLTLVGTQGVASYCVEADSPAEFHTTSAQVSLHTDQGIERVAIEDLPHDQAIALLLDDLADRIAGRAVLEADRLPVGLDGLEAQLATERAHRDACARQRMPSAVGV